MNTPAPKKILVAGVSASGKSTFSRKLSKKTGFPLTLTDSIMWSPGWVYVGDEKTIERLEDVRKSPEWIIEGYLVKGIRASLFEEADQIIHLDYSRIITVYRYLKRCFKHRKNPRPELEGSPERFNFKFFKLVLTKGELISLSKFLNNVSNKGKIVRLRSPREAEDFLKNTPQNSLKTLPKKTSNML